MFGSYALFHKGRFTDRAVIEVVRIINTNKALEEHMNEQLGTNMQYYNLKTRKTFQARLLASTMKYIASFN